MVVVIGAVFYFSKQQTTAPTLDGSPTASPAPRPTPEVTAVLTPGTARIPQTFTISFLSGGSLSADVLTIKAGDTVTFVNRDSKPHWPVTGIHPTHNICPGFDARRGLNTGESYSRAFTEAKTCPFHDHLDPNVSAVKGQIIVTP